MRGNTAGDQPALLRLEMLQVVVTIDEQHPGCIAIEQERDSDGADCILLPPLQARLVAAHLVKLADRLDAEARG